MDSRSTDRQEEFPSVETPEDVAVLYSWANLHGAKYRDFSASRREYRAQLRHRAAEQAREQELLAQADAETAADRAERAARQAQQMAHAQADEAESQRQRALQMAQEAARVAAAERIEAARRAEAAALAEEAAQRERREIAEANASARRQAAQYAESDSRRRRMAEYQDDAELPGTISDPYTPAQKTFAAPAAPEVRGSGSGEGSVELRPTRYRSPSDWSVEREREQEMGPGDGWNYEPATEQREERAHEAAVLHPIQQQPMEAPIGRVPEQVVSSRVPRRQGYRPDDASGVREIYRGPGSSAPASPAREVMSAGSRSGSERTPTNRSVGSAHQQSHAGAQGRSQEPSHRRTIWAGSAPEERTGGAMSDDRAPLPAASGASAASNPAAASVSVPVLEGTPRRRRQDQLPAYQTDSGSGSRAKTVDQRATRSAADEAAGPVAPYWYAGSPTVDGASNGMAAGGSSQSGSESGGGTNGGSGAGSRPPVNRDLGDRRVPAGEPVAPAWIYSPSAGEAAGPISAAAAPLHASVADTLQQSRERVASRWYALKGVFDQPGQEQAEPQPVRQKETRTPVLAVFSLAGGVGKTSLVATLGRTLSSMGEKVLLTDTTSHGLLPFYFGASELRQGTVRTFSPPSGSTDAPIYLVSYDVDGRRDDEAQELLVEEITANGRGTHRVLLDLSTVSSWLLRRMAHLNPTILVPVAPDMNSVISLGGVERFFKGMTDADGAPSKVFYVLNQFDASLPLHLDVREVLRRQLGDRLLPFVIRRAPAVSEALAEGMTIIDYSPDTPVAEDYLNVATWLRSQAAPATAGFRNVRWSER